VWRRSRSLRDVSNELTDRYGKPPAAVRNLLEYAHAETCSDAGGGPTVIERKRDLVNIKFRQNAAIDPGKLARFVASQRGSQFLPDGTLKFSIKVNSADAVLQNVCVICWKN